MSTRTVAGRPRAGRLSVVLLAAVLSVVAAPGRARAQAEGVVTIDQPELVHENGRTFLRRGGAQAARQPTRLIVKLRPGRTAASLPSGSRAFPQRPDLFLVPASAGMTVEETARQLARRPDVVYAEPDYPLQLATEPNDPRWSEQWDMVKIAAPTAWSSQTNSADVVVAVIDTGINFSHPDLQANVWTDPLDGGHGFTCLNGTVTAGGLDDNGHGTHVSGTIGAAGDDGIGIAGINWSVQLLSLKVLSASGNGNVSDAAACFDKLVELKQRGINIRVSSNSWATSGYSQTLRDAMARAEAAGVLHVCAAGNSGTNLEFHPSYPAGFDGRGILAVAATDASDLPPSFTNSGFASVDLSAPGVSTLSTVPTGTCTLCDPSGYRLLSGTSMATPHVSGAAAALFHLNPALTPAEVRDVLLDPASVDSLASVSLRAYTTTYARLNVAKAINNPLVSAPVLNGFPQLSTPDFVTRTPGDNVTLTATASDPDGDTVKEQWGKPHKSYLVAAMINNVSTPGWYYPPVLNVNPLVFPAQVFDRLASIEYLAFVNDGRGGSATGRTWLNILPSASPGLPPTGTITATPASGPAGTTVKLGYTGTDPEGGSLLWGFTGPIGTCCHDPSSWTYNLTFSSPTVARFSAQSIDRQLNLSEWSSVVVRIGGATGEPPVANLTVNATDGTPPFTVSYDATGSYDPDGGTLTFFPECEVGTHFELSAGLPTGTCTFETYGPHTIGLSVYDNDRYSDDRIAYVMVHPEIPPDTAAPTVSITAPAAGASLAGTVAVNVSAADDRGVTRVEVYRDDDVLLGTDTTPPHSVAWNTAGLSPGPYALFAKAWDQTGNTTTSATIAVSIRDVTAPTLAITAPATGASVSGQVTIAVDAADNVGVARVEVYRDSGTLIGTTTAAPYRVPWSTAGVSVGSHTLYAKAWDQAGNSATSGTIAVSTLDVTAPTVAIRTPAAGASVSGLVTIAADAADNVGVTRVEVYRDDNVLIGMDTTWPYSVPWDTAGVSVGSHALYAKAWDQAGNTTTSATVPVSIRDVTAPTAAITAPAAGASISGLVTITADAADDVGVTRVEVYSGTALLGTATAAPYSVTWDTSVLWPMSYTLYAKAYDQQGNAGTSASVPVTVLDSVPPTVTIISPQAGSVLEGGPLYINVTASDNVGVVKVEFYRDSALVGTLTSTPYYIPWDTSQEAPGPHTLAVKAYDQQGNLGTYSTPVTVDLQAPSVSLTSPAAGASVSGSVPINASASDDVGVTKVEVYLDGSVLLGTDTAAPFGITWNSSTATAGAHTLTAKAYDSWPHTKTSAAISVTVLDSTPPTVSITSPAEGAGVARNAATTITASASDNVGVTKVEFYVGTTLTCTDTSSPFTCSWRVPKTAGVQYSLQAKAYDARNNAGTSAAIHVTAN